MGMFLPDGIPWPLWLKSASDEQVQRPLWEYPPDARKAVIHERRVRWGVDDDEGLGFEHG